MTSGFDNFGKKMIVCLTVLALLSTAMVCIITDDNSSAATTHKYNVGDTVSFTSALFYTAVYGEECPVPGCSYSMYSGPQSPAVVSGTATTEGVYFITYGSTIADVVYVVSSDLTSSTLSDPLTSFTEAGIDLPGGTYTIYMEVGSQINIAGLNPTEGNQMSEITATDSSSYGLTCSTYLLYGTVSKAGNLTVIVSNDSQTTKDDFEWTSTLNFVFVESSTAVQTYDHKITYMDGSTTLDTQNESTTDSATVTSTIKYNPTKDGYTFKGWSMNSSGSVIHYQYGDSVDIPTTGLTLYAVWEEIVTKITVTFNANGGSVSTTSKTGTSISLPTPYYSGYTFDGWYTSSTGGTKVSSPYTPTGDITLYAHWTKSTERHTYYIYYYGNGGTNNGNTTYKTGSVESNYGTTEYLTLAKNPFTYEGYTFTGWKINNAVYQPGASYPVKADSTVYAYAQWTSNSYKVTFSNSYGSNGDSSTNAEKNTTIYLPDPGTRSGYEFTGWYTSSSGGTYVGGYGSSYTVTSAVTLYAQWKQVYTHTIVYDKNDGSGSMADSVVTDYTSGTSSVVLKSNAFSRTGYVFSGWKIGSIVYQPGSSYPVSGNSSVTAYAQWSQSYTHTIIYNSNGGDGIVDDTVVADTNSGYSSIKLAENKYTKSCHTFEGWLINGILYQPGDSYPVNGDASVTATAQWTQNNITIHEMDTQYAMVGRAMSFNVGADITPSGDVTFAVTNVPSNLIVSVSGSAITVASTVEGTYTFTLTATSTNYVPDSVTITVVVDPILAFTNSVTDGELSIKGVSR